MEECDPQGSHVIRKDLIEMEIKEEEWFGKATTSRAEWRSTYRQARTNFPCEQPHLARITLSKNYSKLASTVSRMPPHVPQGR